MVFSKSSVLFLMSCRGHWNISSLNTNMCRLQVHVLRPRLNTCIRSLKVATMASLKQKVQVSKACSRELIGRNTDEHGMDRDGRGCHVTYTEWGG